MSCSPLRAHAPPHMPPDATSHETAQNAARSHKGAWANRRSPRAGAWQAALPERQGLPALETPASPKGLRLHDITGVGTGWSSSGARLANRRAAQGQHPRESPRVAGYAAIIQAVREGVLEHRQAEREGAGWRTGWGRGARAGWAGWNRGVPHHALLEVHSQNKLNPGEQRIQVVWQRDLPGQGHWPWTKEVGCALGG